MPRMDEDSAYKSGKNWRTEDNKQVSVHGLAGRRRKKSVKGRQQRQRYEYLQRSNQACIYSLKAAAAQTAHASMAYDTEYKMTYQTFDTFLF